MGEKIAVKVELQEWDQICGVGKGWHCCRHNMKQRHSIKIIKHL